MQIHAPPTPKHTPLPRPRPRPRRCLPRRPRPRRWRPPRRRRASAGVEASVFTAAASVVTPTAVPTVVPTALMHQNSAMAMAATICAKRLVRCVIPRTQGRCVHNVLPRRGFRPAQSCPDPITARTQTSRDSMTLGRLLGKLARRCLQRRRPRLRTKRVTSDPGGDYAAHRDNGYGRIESD